MDNAATPLYTSFIGLSREVASAAEIEAAGEPVAGTIC